MHYELTAIVVTDTKLFNRTGDIGRWAERIQLTYTKNAIAAAPSSLESGRPNKSRANAAYPSGSMKANIFGSVNRVGVRQLETLVWVSVPYARYVLKGTGPWIFSKSARIPAGQSGAGQFVPLTKGTGMFLPGQPAWAERRRQRVRGQKANNFLESAFAKTAVTHSSLRGYHMVG